MWVSQQNGINVLHQNKHNELRYDEHLWSTTFLNMTCLEIFAKRALCRRYHLALYTNLSIREQNQTKIY